MVEKSDFVRLTKSWVDMVPRYVDFKRYFMSDKFIFFQLSIYFILYDFKFIYLLNNVLNNLFRHTSVYLLDLCSELNMAFIEIVRNHSDFNKIYFHRIHLLHKHFSI